MKKSMLVAIVSVLFALSAVSVALAPQKAPAGPPAIVNEMVAKAKAAVKSVPTDQVKAVVEKKDNAILLDVRDPNEFSAGHLPGAVNVSRGLLEWRIWAAVPDPNAKVFVYCRTGGR